MTTTSPLMLEQALQHAGRLADVLGREFECLRQSDMDGFEALQSAKHESLEVLEKISQSMGDQWRTDPAWAGFLHQVSECRDAHRRNELLLRRQLDAVRGALETLVADAQAEPGLYDHMGQRSARAIRALHSYA